MKASRCFFLALSAPLLLASCANKTATATPIAVGSLPSWSQKEVVNYMLNYSKATFEESSLSGKTNDLCYRSESITPPSKLTPPEQNPTRTGYDFTGWYKEDTTVTLFDFANESANSSLFLYAGWKRSGGNDYVEPAYTPVETIDDTLTSNLKLTGILNVAPTYGSCYLTNGGMLRLANSPNDVRFAINCVKKTGTSITSAVYDAASSLVTVTSKNGDSVETSSLGVGLISGNLALANTTYEAKAKAFETAGAAFENNHIMLAGSSSIEFWTNYASDLAPIVAYSHGIGGTMASDWNASLLDRLVVPYCPKAVVYYVGVNDLVNGNSDNDTLVKNIETLFEDTHAKLPNTHIFYILINKLPGYYLGYQERIEAIDAAISAYQNGKSSWLELIDAGKVLLKSNGVADASYFRLDNLHMSEYGYVLWAAEIKKALEAWLG